LDDGTGVIPVLLWSNLVEALDTPPAAGQMVEVVGEVTVYQDELELIPRSLHDWRLGP
jgi:exonuclease VII large subunit